jgi:hypothetical protein
MWPFGKQEKTMSGFKIELGSKVRCKITGFLGVAHGRSEWLHGCRTYMVKPIELKDGKPQESVGFDEDALEVLDQAKPHEMKTTGGPGDTPASPAGVSR